MTIEAIGIGGGEEQQPYASRTTARSQEAVAVPRRRYLCLLSARLEPRAVILAILIYFLSSLRHIASAFRSFISQVWYYGALVYSVVSFGIFWSHPLGQWAMIGGLLCLSLEKAENILNICRGFAWRVVHNNSTLTSWLLNLLIFGSRVRLDTKADSSCDIPPFSEPLVSSRRRYLILHPIIMRLEYHVQF